LNTIIGLEWAEKEIDLFQDEGQIKREKDIYHHGPRPICIICHLPDPLLFHYPLPLNFFKFSFKYFWPETMVIQCLWPGSCSSVLLIRILFLQKKVSLVGVLIRT
jgi:hypothetical protein